MGSGDGLQLAPERPNCLTRRHKIGVRKTSLGFCRCQRIISKCLDLCWYKRSGFAFEIGLRKTFTIQVDGLSVLGTNDTEGWGVWRGTSSLIRGGLTALRLMRF